MHHRTIRLIRKLAIVGVLGLCIDAAALAMPPFDWFAPGLANPGPYPTKEAAEGAVRTSSARMALLVKEKKLSVASTGSVFRLLASNPTSGYPTSGWLYTNYENGTFTDEGSAVSDFLSRRVYECGAPSASPIGDWVSVNSVAGVSVEETKSYSITTHPGSISAQTCTTSTSSFPLDRTRGAACPTYYHASGTGCVDDDIFDITGPGTGQGTPVEACEAPPSSSPNGLSNGANNATGTSGIDFSASGAASSSCANPVNTATGDKWQLERDYEGVGIALARYYHSIPLDSSHGIGAGWSHSYSASLIFYPVTGDFSGALRPSGQSVSFYSDGTGHYESDDGSGLEVSQAASGLWNLTRNDGTIETYDPNGRLLSVNDHGWLTTINYADALGSQITSVVGPFGHTLTFGYPVGGGTTVMKITDPSGHDIVFGYDSANNLSSVTYPDGTSRHYLYENASYPNNLTGIVDERGIRYATYSFDAQGRAATSEHAGGTQKFTFTYNDTNTVATDPRGTVTTYGFTPGNAGRRVTSFASAGVSRSAVLGTWPTELLRRAAQVTNERGYTTTYQYTLHGVSSVTEASGTARARTTSYAYLNNDSNLPTLIAEPGRTTAMTYNANGKMLTRTVTDTGIGTSRTWTWTYNASGQMLTADGPRTDVSDVTTYTYYSCFSGNQCGRVQSVTNAASQVTSYDFYNAHGQPTQITDPNGVVTSLVYDLRQRLTSRTTALETTSYTYWPNGLIKRVTLPDASYLDYGYDDAGRLVQISDGAGNHVSYTLDLMGNRTAENVYDPTNLLQRAHTQEFDALNRLSKDINAAGTAAVSSVYGYDNANNLLTVAAPLARNTTNVYDELNRLTQITDAGSGVTHLAYDPLNHLTTVSDPRGLTTSYAYNGLDDLQQIISPDTGTTQNTFDSGGNVATSADARAAVTTTTYDALNRPKTIAYKIGATTDQTITLGYDAGTNGKGRLTSATDANHTLVWVYDPLARVLNKQQILGSVTKSVGYTYSSGRLATMTLPSGQVVTYGYNSLGQLTSLQLGSTMILSAATYDALGPVNGWTWGNGTASSRTRDLDGKVTQITSPTQKTFGYDDAFRVTAITDAANGANSWSYGYDLLDRLTSASKSGTTQGWNYDPNGNRLAQTGTTASTYNVSTTSNRINSTTGSLARTYTYNASGSALTYSTVTATYYNSGRLKTLKQGSSTSTYVYNALGQLAKQSGGVPGTVLYMYDEAGHLLGEYSSSGALVQETIWLGSIPVATIRPKTGGVDIFYVHTDQLNTPRKVTQPTNNGVRWTWESDPFGTTLPNENPQALGAFKYNLRFPGQMFDGQAGLHQNYFRDYDPALGRYVQSDPIGLGGGINTFAYALAPTMHTDPLGLAEDSITTRIMTLIRNGDSAELNNLLESGGLNPAQEGLVKQGLTRAGDLIRGGLKKSKSYASELADKSYAEICQLAKGSGDLANKASKMKKLIEQADRLAGKGY